MCVKHLEECLLVNENKCWLPLLITKGSLHMNVYYIHHYSNIFICILEAQHAKIT